jgi:hypothetical protein
MLGAVHLEVEGAQLLTEFREVFALRINKDNLASRMETIACKSRHADLAKHAKDQDRMRARGR